MTHLSRFLCRVTAGAAAALLGALPAAAQVVEYYHLDAIGNVRAVSNQNGSLIEQHNYYPYGEEWCAGPPAGLCSSEPSGQTRRFTGKERDQETGLDYFGARHYGSRIGRFTAVDLYLDQTEALTDPQRWNRYAYGLNNPLRYADPDGRNPLLLQRLLQALQTQVANVRMWGARLASSPVAQEVVQGGVQLASGADLPPAPGSGAYVGSSLRFAQKGISEVFRHGEFAGMTIEAIATGLRRGDIHLEQIPVKFITRDGVRYAINNRSLMAVRMAGFGEGVVEDVTGVAKYEAQLTKRLKEIALEHPGGPGPGFSPVIRKTVQTVDEE